MPHQGPEGSSTPGKPVLTLQQVNVLAILCWIKPWIQTFYPTAVTSCAEWLDLNTFPHAEYALPRTRRLLNTWKSGFSVMESQIFWPFLLNQTTNTDILILLLWHSVLTVSIWIPFHLRNMLYQGSEGSSTPGKHVLPLWQVNVVAAHWLVVMPKQVFEVLKSLLVLGRVYSTGGKVFRSSLSAPRVTAVGSESLYSWHDSA